MTTMSRRTFFGLSGGGVAGLMLGGSVHFATQTGRQASAFDALYVKFRDPDRKYSIRPFWFWNGELTGEELGRQIRQMVEHGVYGAYAHNRDGLETPYLSEAWWKVLGEALNAAREEGFSLCMVDEFEWPSGEARDYWMAGSNKSRVVAANPDFHMRRLRPTETILEGPRKAKIPLAEHTVLAVAGRRLGSGYLDGATLHTLALEPRTKALEWDVPEGQWLVTTYGLDRAVGQPDHGTVDLMSKEAVAKYIEIYYEEFRRRYDEYLGSVMPATFADHEGTYGDKLPWTPALFETFQRRTGYSLEPYLPALSYDIGAKTEKVRSDLLDTVSELYSQNFFKQVTDWCARNKVEHSGHVWEESLFFGPAYQGDFFRILRSMSNPGCDTLVEWGRQSVWLKEVASVADFEGRHVVCENQGVQGYDSYLSPEGMRRVSNCLGAWNVGEFIPHAFDYDLSRINFPPDWFGSQPYLAWFRSYADQMRRISFINVEGQHVAPLLLFYPQVSIWGQSAPAFRSEQFARVLEDSSWSQDAVETNSMYAQLKLQLSEARLDYKVADDDYLAESRTEDKQVKIRDSSFSALILPPMSTMRRSSAERVRDFYRAGGTVIALRRLPTISVENGRADAVLQAIWNSVFDAQPSLRPFQVRQNEAGGRAYFVPGSVPDLLEVLRGVIEPDVEIADGSADHLYVLHKRHDGIDLFWVVNDAEQPRTWMLRFKAKGRPERWDAHTGLREPLFYQSQSAKTVVRLALNSWDAAYVAFDPAGHDQPLTLAATSLDELHLASTDPAKPVVHGRALGEKGKAFVELADGARRYRGEYQPASLEPVEIVGDWKVTVDGGVIPLPYAKVKDDPDDHSLKERWFESHGGVETWSPLWLSPVNRSIREWNLLGPFPNPQERGLEESYAPEQSIDYAAVYRGDEGQELRWLEVNSSDYHVGPAGGAWNLGTAEVRGGPYGPEANIVKYGPLLRLHPLHGTVFAQTNVYAPQTTEAKVVLATPNPTAVFVNGEKVYSRWVRALYYDLTDGFSLRVPVRLKAGWNSLLLKFLHNADGGSPHFSCRIDSSDGVAIEALIARPRVLRSHAPAEQPGYRWLRFDVPPLAGLLRVPALRRPWTAFVDAEQTPPGAEIGCRGKRVVMLRLAAAEILDRPFAFATVDAQLQLGTWSRPGLQHFSGLMTYEKVVDIAASLLRERLLLDCGQVGVAAEAWMNGKPVGSRPWAPYVFDVTEAIHAGRNVLKVRIANTAGNARAVGPSLANLKNIDVNGWHGPARLVPLVDRDIECRLV